VFWYGLLLLALILAPLVLDSFYIGEMSMIFVYAIAGLGLMLLVGFTGQISLGHAAFLAIGAYAHAYLISHGWPFLLALPMAGLISAAAGVLIAIPASRMTGIYLAIATLAFAIIVEQAAIHFTVVTGGFGGMMVDYPVLFGVSMTETWQLYFICLAVLILVLLGCANLLRSPTGRAFMAIRDSEVSAQSMGIHLARYKTLSFAISAALAGIGGALYAHKLQFISPDQFNILQSVDLVLMIVIGGIGSIHGAFLGAIFLITMPQVINLSKDWLPATIGQAPGLQGLVYGLVLIAFVLFEPLGLYGRWLKMRTYLQIFPFYRKGMFQRQKSYLKSDRLK
jgi:branched-chain amino acid transport system permease protein